MVKKIILLVSIGLSMVFRGMAFKTAKFYMGVEAGAATTWITGSPIIYHYFQSKIAWSGGVSFQYNFNTKLSIRAILSYDKMGPRSFPELATLDSSGTSTGEVRAYQNWNYLILPILMQYTVGRKIKYRIAGGPFVGYLTRAKVKLRGENIKPMTVYQERMTQPFDIGAIVNLAVIFPVRKNMFFSVEARRTLGLYNISKMDLFQTIRNESVGLLFGVQYLF